MYQVLQVFTSFSFSLIDNFLSRSIKVGQVLSRRCRKVTETSLKSRGDVVSTFCQSPWSPVSLGDIALVENTLNCCDVSETYWISRKSIQRVSEKLNMFDFTVTPSPPAKSPGQ